MTDETPRDPVASAPERHAPEPSVPEPSVPEPSTPEPSVPEPSTPDRGGRPILERIGLAAIALVLASLFGAVAAAAIAGGELFLGAMGVMGCLMTLWVGVQTLIRG